MGPLHLDYKLILGSGSPRRASLLTDLGLNFELRIVPIDEESFEYPIPEEIALKLAILKSHAIPITDHELLLTADTTVLCEGHLLGKAPDRTSAIEMLQFLSGRTHRVDTGVCLRTLHKEIHLQSTTMVEWYPLKQAEIEWYIDHYHPFDKAGAYGIQEWMGQRAIRSIHGCPLNVMGLPLPLLYESLQSEFRS
jgi:septum formation protein